MPTIEYACPHCRHVFQRVVLLGDEALSETCPRCGRKDVPPVKKSESLFGGRYLPKDTN